MQKLAELAQAAHSNAKQAVLASRLRSEHSASSQRNLFAAKPSRHMEASFESPTYASRISQDYSRTRSNSTMRKPLITDSSLCTTNYPL